MTIGPRFVVCVFDGDQIGIALMRSGKRFEAELLKTVANSWRVPCPSMLPVGLSEPARAIDAGQREDDRIN
ncbi:MAG: hypothetical protein EOQ57_26900 [Mesorhizobium sp.]|uniref:hypothetical protein n=1 Tax=Mesorhizobium sp. TaxID=1871066 RepID=UPI000FE5763B|nr:hypothetical protein [Mesorhizobium sp.]RWB96346.1 MAG: hypothetical protein EOQ57_26900 [Mesorhizobium sp.]